MPVDQVIFRIGRAIAALFQLVMEENIAFQQQMIAKLVGGGHDVRAAKMSLRQLESECAKHAAERDRLSQKLADGF